MSIDLEKTFVTADDHWGHKNIIHLSKRPFSDINEMNEALIQNWNSIVPSDGTVYHLGDMFYKMPLDKAYSILERLNGQIHLIEGNHDQVTVQLRHPKIQFLGGLHMIWIGKTKLVMCHYAMRVWQSSHKGSWHIYGHSHGGLPENGTLSFDVGVDCWDYTPISLSTVVNKMVRIEQNAKKHGRSAYAIHHEKPKFVPLPDEAE